MDFALTEEQRLLSDTVREFCERELIPHEEILEKTAVAGAPPGGNTEGGADKTDSGAMDDGFAFQKARVGRQKLCGEVVRSLKHDVDAAHHLARDSRQQSRTDQGDLGRPLAFKSFLGSVQFVPTEIFITEKDLSVQVRFVDLVVVAEHETSDTSPSESESCRTPKSTHSDDERTLVLKFS